ncbi:MAG: diguanylate cyclase domain-containing protein [Acidimicrobiales bacterium]
MSAEPSAEAGRATGRADVDDAVSDGLLPVPAVVVDAGIVVAASPTALALTPHAALGTGLADWFDPLEAEVVAHTLLRGVRHEPPRVRVRDGEALIAIHASGDPDGGRQVVLLRDATDESFVRAAVDAVADSTFVIDAVGGNRWRSARLRERSGVPDQVAARVPAGERLHPEDMPLVFETFASVTEDAPLTVVTRSRAVDDDDRWEWIEMTVWHRIAHEVLRGYLVQVRNLDEGRTLKTALSHADPELLSLTDAAPVGIAVTDPAGQIVYRNPAARGLLGPDVQTFGGGDWLALALPEHRAPLAGAFDAALRDGHESTVTAAFDEPDGLGPRWLRLRVRSQRFDTERPTGVIATIEDVTEQVEARAALEAAEERMRHLATHDTLTGLPNRAALTEELDRAVSRQDRSGTGLAVLFCDLDSFKPVNDRLGHAEGDAVLVEVAARLRSVVRDADFVARLGGDEFVVLCEGSGPTTAVIDELAARLHAVMEPRVDLDDESVKVGLSIGVAMLEPGGSCAADRLLLLADQAMYDAKAAGRGRTCICWTLRPETSTAS